MRLQPDALCIAVFSFRFFSFSHTSHHRHTHSFPSFASSRSFLHSGSTFAVMTFPRLSSSATTRPSRRSRFGEIHVNNGRYWNKERRYLATVIGKRRIVSKSSIIVSVDLLPSFCKLSQAYYPVSALPEAHLGGRGEPPQPLRVRCFASRPDRCPRTLPPACALRGKTRRQASRGDFDASE